MFGYLAGLGFEKIFSANSEGFDEGGNTLY